MVQKHINKDSLERIKAIHALSLKYNQAVNKKHNERLLELMKKHIVEIQELFEQKDPHAFVENGDLIILCFELLLENDLSIDGILEECFQRYEKKLNELINNCSHQGVKDVS